MPYQFFIKKYFHSYFQIENFKRHICSKYLWINHLNWAQLWSTSTLKTILVPQLQVQKQWGDHYFCCLVKEQITSWSNTEQKRMTRNTSFHVVYEEWFHQRALQSLSKTGCSHIGLPSEGTWKHDEMGRVHGILKRRE